MRLLVFSDVHANATALDAALAASAERWDAALCLGDIVGYGPDPNQTADRVRSVSASTVRGNHDRGASGLIPLEEFTAGAQQALVWTRGQLRADNLEYLKNLPCGPVLAEGVALVHGALEDEDQYVFAPSQALDGLLTSPCPVTFFGHTHHQGGFSYRDEHVEVIHLRPSPNMGFAALRVEPGTRYLLNPGSIGQPRDGDPRAAFAIADLEHGVVEFWRVPYDIAAVQGRMKEAGAPESLITRLEAGR